MPGRDQAGAAVPDGRWCIWRRTSFPTDLPISEHYSRSGRATEPGLAGSQVTADVSVGRKETQKKRP
jgi:hypothetical protein